MRRLIITQNVTLDGCVEMLDPWFDPSDQDDELTAELQRQDQTNDAIVLGRQTFEAFRSFWPQQVDDTTGVTDHLNRTQKYVVSSTMTDPAWQHSTVIDRDPVAAIHELKSHQGGDIVCTGSIQLSHALLSAGLVDEYRMFTYPAVQGRGRRFFPDGFTAGDLRLTDARRFSRGVSYTAYTVGQRST